MRRNKIYIIVLLSLLLLAAYFYFSGNKSTLNKREKDFSIEDTSGIFKITIAGRKDTVKLFKDHNTWKVNNIYNVNKRSLYYFLSMQKRIAVNSPASKEKQDIVAEKMDTGAVYVKILRERKRDKQYYVFKEQEKGETYMRQGTSGRIFKVYIPSYKGDVADLYITNKLFWRDNTLFNIPVNQLMSLDVSYPGEQDKSYHISVDKHGEIIFNEEKPDTLAKKKIVNYLYEYENVTLKRYLDSMPEGLSRENGNISPVCEIAVVSEDISKTVAFYNKQVGEEEAIDNLGTAIKYDPHLMYGLIKNSKEWFTISYIDIAPLLKEKKYFMIP